MKKLAVLSTVLVAAAVLAICVSASGNGAVKTEFDPNVGWVILNTTASGKLNCSAHIDNGLPDEEFMVSIRVRYEDGIVDEHADIATLRTNGQGKGNLQIQVDIDPPSGSTTLRRVAFRVRRPGPPNILYNAIAWDIPLKP